MVFRPGAMVVTRLIVFSVWVTAAAAVNAPYCRCSDHTLPPSSSSLPPSSSSSSSLPPPDPCNGVRCQHGGTCEADGDTFICRCADGYEGQFCQDGIVLTSCDGVNCNRGRCREDGGVARCVCENGGTGVFCENDLCLSVICGLNQPDPHSFMFAECYVFDYVDEGDYPFECQCEETFAYGRFCDQARCESFGAQFACNLNGECIEDERETNLSEDVCDCNDGFYGDMCIYGPCPEDRCQNGGSCRYFFSETPNGCDCRDGFSGASCEIVTCFGNSCLNGGTCEVEGDEFRCMCAEGFSGELCEIDLSLCFGVTCLNGGTCIGTSEYDAGCLCPNGYSGDTCQLGPCLSSQRQTFCQNGGSCVADRKKNLLVGCECAEGFSGAMCEVGPCPDGVVCENGGVCVIVNGDFNSCRCPSGVTGDRCEIA